MQEKGPLYALVSHAQANALSHLSDATKQAYECCLSVVSLQRELDQSAHMIPMEACIKMGLTVVDLIDTLTTALHDSAQANGEIEEDDLMHAAAQGELQKYLDDMRDRIRYDKSAFDGRDPQDD